MSALSLLGRSRKRSSLPPDRTHSRYLPSSDPKRSLPSKFLFHSRKRLWKYPLSSCAVNLHQQVTITVTDPSGKYVTDLKEGDFRVFENGEQRPIGFFRVDRSAPVSVGIIVDCSMSMTTKLTQARRAITRMVADLDPRDEIFLAAFSATAGMVQPFTFDHQRIVDRLKFLHPFTQTALYDAVSMGLYEMRRARRDKRALLVVTDGMDNRSTTTRAEVIASARALKVLIYTIGIGDEAAKRGDQFLGGIFSPDEDEVDMPTA